MIKEIATAIKNRFAMTRQSGTVVVYQKEYELLKKAAFGDLKERQAATKALRKFTTDALRKETLKSKMSKEMLKQVQHDALQRVQGDDWRVA